ncbi:hypothetical protein GM658_14210 [Pseudoduganella eburnea]|uniref:Uncharacterized protein n=1 Tax=Massilia eburnea TaxID=1776165 RepID=A0A6L6QJD4_9BURK|nr:hypothetical protein [Massilia eburnea]MTW11756.1 hypothetical protein [Massilia eburnea]
MLEEIPGNNVDIEINKNAVGFLAFAGDDGSEILANRSTGRPSSTGELQP